MASRPFAFGARLRAGERTLRVRQHDGAFVVEDARAGRPARRRAHPDLPSALRDLARTWRGRLH